MGRRPSAKPPGTRTRLTSRAADLALIRRCLAIENPVLRQAPALLFQCLWNRLSSTRELSSNLRVALERAREQFERNGRPWLRRLNRLHSSPEITRFNGHQKSPKGLCFSPDGTRVLSIDEGGTCILWNAETGREDFSFTSKVRGVGRVQFSKDGTKLLVTGSSETDIRDALDGAPFRTLNGGWGLFVADGKGVMTSDGSIWDLASGATCFKTAFPCREVRLQGLSRDETRLFAVCEGQPAIINRGSGTIERLFRPGNGWVSQGWGGSVLPITAVSCSPDGRRWAISNAAQTCLWTTGPDGVVFNHHQIGMVLSSAFSPDGKQLLLGCENGMCLVVSADTGKVLSAPVLASERVCVLAFSPDGRRVVSGYYGACVVWEFEPRAGGEEDIVGSPAYLTPDWGDMDDCGVTDRCITFVSFSKRGPEIVAAGRHSRLGTWDELCLVEGMFRRRTVQGRWLDKDGYWPCSTLEGSITMGPTPWPKETFGELVRPNRNPSAITSDGKYTVVVDPGLGLCRVFRGDEEFPAAEYFASCSLWSVCAGANPNEILLGDGKGEVHWLKIEDPPVGS